jgi:hypothetical protein
MRKKTIKLLAITLMGAMSLFLSSCYTEDPGDLRPAEETYDIVDFDRLEMGDEFVIRVEQGNFFSVSVRGDERNIDDLIVRKEGSTLIVRYEDNHNRKHDTYIDITMPVLHEVNFSGASNSVVTGFLHDGVFKISLSGGSVSQIDLDGEVTDLSLSGASILTLTGSSAELSAGVSGASVLKAFNFPVDEAYVNASGASSVKVTVANKLNAVASGASSILYRGSPAVTSNVSGGSSVHHD